MPDLIGVFIECTSHGVCHLPAYKLLNQNTEVSNLGRQLLHCVPFTAQDSLVPHADSEDSYQTAHMPSLI